MMKILKYFGALVIVGIMASCTNQPSFKDVIYFAGTEETSVLKYSIEGYDDIGITVRASSKVKEDIKIELEIDTTLISVYNKEHNTFYSAMPDGIYRLLENVTTIKEGQANSSPVILSIRTDVGMTDEGTYCVPIRIKGVEGGGLPLLESGRVIYIVLNKTIITKAAYLGYNYLQVDFNSDPNRDLSALPAVTMEARINVTAFAGRSPFISTVMGLEEHFLIRMGDVKIDPNILQIAGDAPVISSEGLAAKKWVHVAATYDGGMSRLFIDGKQVGSSDKGRSPICLFGIDEQRTFHLGETGGNGSGGRTLDGYMSEARVWSRALSADELQFGMCAVAPDAPGLVAYWKLNSATLGANGRYFIPDYTGNGYHAVSARSGERQFMEDVRCP